MPAKKENVSQLNSQAIKLAANGEYKEAIACFQKAITLEKNNYRLWYNLGVTYRDTGDLLRAKESLDKAYSIETEDDQVIEMLALIDFNIGLTTEALQFCHEGLENNCNNSRLWNTLGVIYFNLEKYENAAEAFEQAITIDPYYYDALFNLRDTYEETGNKVGYKLCNEQLKAIKNFGQTNA